MKCFPINSWKIQVFLERKGISYFFFKIRKCFFLFFREYPCFLFRHDLDFLYILSGWWLYFVCFLFSLFAFFLCVCMNITARGVKLCDGLVKLQAKALSKQAGKHNVKVQNVVKFDNKQDALASFVNHGHIKCNNCFYD